MLHRLASEYSDEIERRLLYALCHDADLAFPRVGNLLKHDGSEFYGKGHQAIFKAALDLWDAHKLKDRFDSAVFLDELHRRNELRRLQHILPQVIAAPEGVANWGSWQSVEDYCRTIAEHARVREAALHALTVAEHAENRRLGDITRTVQSYLEEGAAGPVRERRELVLTPVSKIRIRPVRWLWDTTPQGESPTSHGRIPMHSLALAAGGPGLGKSQFAVWLAARITRGELPGELRGKPRSVIYAATEDSWSYTIAPRLVAAGADLDLVFRVDVQDDGHPHARLTLPVDTELLGRAAEAYSIALLVADPLLSLIDRGINDYRAAEVRTALEPLVAAADEHRFTILGLAHFTKGGGSDPLTRVAGSGAFGQIIHALIAFAQQEDENGDPEFVMSLEKNNLGRLGLPAHTYTIQPVTVDTEKGPAYVSRFVLGPETNTSVREVMRQEALPETSREETNETRAWLRAYLTDMGGSADVRTIKAAARKNGFSDSSVDRAKRKLGISSKRNGFGEGMRSIWYLPGSLPSEESS